MSCRAQSFALLGLLVGCHGAASVPSAPTPSVTLVASAPVPADPPPHDVPGPTVTAKALPAEPPLLALSRAWAKNDSLMASGHHPSDNLARCPRAGNDVRPENAALLPATFVRFEGIATHACDAVLWVYLGCTAADDQGATCASWAERLVLEPIGTGAARVLGQVESAMGGNSGGLFVPFAFTRGGRFVLLQAWMFPPGAGGGAVDYGVGVVASSARGGTSPLHVEPLPGRDPSFYADFGCAVALAASNKTPTYTQPGFPSNNGGALVSIDLDPLRTRALLEERDTTYSITHVDEKAGTLDVDVARHTFGKDCPREEGALSCATTSASKKRQLPLPACPVARPR